MNPDKSPSPSKRLPVLKGFLCDYETFLDQMLELLAMYDALFLFV